MLLIAWLAVAGWLWLQWMKTAEPSVAQTSAATATANTAPAAASAASLPLPSTGGEANNNSAAMLPGAPAATSASTEGAGQPITVANDMLRLTVDLHGGRVIDSQLLQYTEEKKPGSPNVHLLNSKPGTYYVADAGLISVDGKNAQHELTAQFHTQDGQNSFALAPGASEVAVPLLWTDPATGLSVRRTLSLKRGSYVLELSDQVANAGASAKQLYPFVRLSRVAPPALPKRSFMTNPESLSFVGAAWFTPEKNYEKAKLSDFLKNKPPATEETGGWIAMLQHHFVSAWVPLDNEKHILQTNVETHDGAPLFVVQSVATPLNLAAGASATHATRLWVGPKLQAPMEALTPSLKRAVDYGYLYAIAQPLFWLLSWLHLLFGNWGWAIIAIVVLLKLALYPLSAKQYQSMAKMRAVQPRIEALKERYGEDKQQFQIAMMELYKKEKINPIGGCLPMLIPIPIFLGLYWVLIETVELRHAPWMGWIQNLTAPDPYFILPVLNLIVMFLTQKLSPTPGMDPMQKKMMQFMPLVFGVMMAFFPSGLVLYWVTNGGLGLAQQWWMTKRHGPKTAVVAR
jgi:YidC/Oxa1 family membrane protein insertase